MGPKANNRKTRTGCTQCRLRRVKCDSQTPKCANCTRRNETCEYSTWKLTTPASVAAQHGGNVRDLVVSTKAPLAATRSYAIGEVEKSLDPISISDLMLRLAQHSTFGPDSPAGQERTMWKSAIVPSAGKYDFLHYCLSSLLCLLGETNGLQSSQVCNAAAYQQHLAALASFRKAAVKVDRSNWAIILVFGASVIIFEFGTQQICPDAAFDYMHTLRVLRMSALVTSSTGSFLKQSPIWDYIQSQSFAGGRPMSESLAAIVQLQQTIEASHSSPAFERGPLLQATRMLRGWTMSCSGSPSNVAHYVAFPSMVPDEYLNLLAAENDMALIILIYWCTVMQHGLQKWFIRRWPRRTVSATMAKLTSDWTKLLGWPSSVFGFPLSGLPANLEDESSSSSDLGFGGL